jgi:acetyl/propionyl-CoA carboxylase alpha subunit
MKYKVNIGGRQRLIEIDHQDGSDSVLVDGVPARAEARQIQPGRWSLLIDGRQFDVSLLKGRGGIEIDIGADHYRGEVIDARRPDAPASAALSSRPFELTSLMPGKVSRILVSEGQRVGSDEGIVVVEAMKMENELRSGQAALVERVLVKPGQLVESGTPLVRFAPLPEGG